MAGDGGGEVGEGEGEVVDSGVVEAEDVPGCAGGGGFCGGGGVCGGGGGGGGWRRGDEVGEGAAGVVGEFGEEGLGFLFGEGTHCGVEERGGKW